MTDYQAALARVAEDNAAKQEEYAAGLKAWRQSLGPVAHLVDLRDLTMRRLADFRRATIEDRQAENRDCESAERVRIAGKSLAKRKGKGKSSGTCLPRRRVSRITALQRLLASWNQPPSPRQLALEARRHFPDDAALVDAVFHSYDDLNRALLASCDHKQEATLYQAFHLAIDNLDYRIACLRPSGKTASAVAQVSNVAPTEQAGDQPRSDCRYAFRDRGGFFAIRFDGEAAEIPKLLGAVDCYRLLQQPHRPISLEELIRPLSGATPQADDSELEMLTTCASVAGGYTIDHETRDRLSEIRIEMTRVADEIKHAEDAFVREDLQRNFAALAAAAEKLKRPGGKPRGGATPGRGAALMRKARFIDNCKSKYKLPKFAKHVDAYVEVGPTCIYRPPGRLPPEWNF